jgi:hypothetical protein
MCWHLQNERMLGFVQANWATREIWIPAFAGMTVEPEAYPRNPSVLICAGKRKLIDDLVDRFVKIQFAAWGTNP